MSSQRARLAGRPQRYQHPLPLGVDTDEAKVSGLLGNSSSPPQWRRFVRHGRYQTDQEQAACTSISDQLDFPTGAKKLQPPGNFASQFGGARIADLCKADKRRLAELIRALHALQATSKPEVQTLTTACNTERFPAEMKVEGLKSAPTTNRRSPTNDRVNVRAEVAEDEWVQEDESTAAGQSRAEAPPQRTGQYSSEADQALPHCASSACEESFHTSCLSFQGDHSSNTDANGGVQSPASCSLSPTADSSDAAAYHGTAKTLSSDGSPACEGRKPTHSQTPDMISLHQPHRPPATLLELLMQMDHGSQSFQRRFVGRTDASAHEHGGGGRGSQLSSSSTFGSEHAGSTGDLMFDRQASSAPSASQRPSFQDINDALAVSALLNDNPFVSHTPLD